MFDESFKKIHSVYSELTKKLVNLPELKPLIIQLYSELVHLQGAVKQMQKSAEKQKPTLATEDRLYHQAKSILLESNLERLLNFSVDAIIQITQANRGFIAVLAPSGGFDLYAARSIGSKEIEDPNSKISKTILQETLDGGSLRTISFKDDPSKIYQSIEGLNIGSVLSFPVEYQGKYIAILYLDKDEGQPPFDPTKNLELLEFCQLLAPKINQLKLTAEQDRENLSKEESVFQFSGFSGRSLVFNDVIKLASRVAKSEATVLILGESGTGKELIANAIHGSSSRREQPFVAVNCSAIPADLIESELFGYEKGAFTGATQRKPGKFELADGGTIFLDEIGDLSFDLQSKLLRTIQDKKIDVLGGKQPLSINVRVIAATNKNLKSMTETHQFREDLYYRLNVVSINLPPLRNRRIDLPLLTKYLLDKLSKKMGKSSYSVDEKALNALVDYDWPGNIRELENVLERALILSDDSIIQLQDLPPEIIEDIDLESTSEMNFNDLVENYKRELITNALAKANGNKSQAAKILGISRNYFHQWTNR